MERGLLRLYYADRDGREWNKGVAAEGTFTGSIAAGPLDLPAPPSVQALEPPSPLAARWGDLEALYDRHPALERLGRRFAERIVVRKEMRERAFLEQTATERYQEAIRRLADDLFARSGRTRSGSEHATGSAKSRSGRPSAVDRRRLARPAAERTRERAGLREAQ